MKVNNKASHFKPCLMTSVIPFTGRATGYRVILSEYLREFGDELKAEYNKLTSTEKRACREEILALREERSTMKARSNLKAVQTEVRSAFGKLKMDVS